MDGKLPPMNGALREVFRVAYVFRQKYQHPTRDNVYWENAAAEMKSLIDHCGGHPFAVGIMLACYEDIERELKEIERATSAQ